MKVIHLLPSLQSGGVEQVVLELSHHFTEQGIDNIVISEGGRLASQLKQEGSRHINLPIGKKKPGTLRHILSLRRIILEERPDILHLHSRMPAWIGYLAWKTLAKKDRPGLVSSVHGFYSVNAYSAIMCKGQRVIAVSECIKEYINNKYPKTPDDIIRVIPNAINPVHHYVGFIPQPEWTRGWMLSNPELMGKFTLCLPGRITRLKGQLDLIPILKILLERNIPAHAVIVGEAKKGKESYEQEVRDAFTNAGLGEHVSWIGHRSDLREVQASCSITLSLTQVPESFGKTTLEALALGKPVAGYDHGGVKEQLQAFLPEGLIPVGDTKSMATLLEQWYYYPPIVLQEIPPPYRMSDMINAHLNTYRELCPTL
ncbi:MAG: glycosyltransferase family 4 protein [Akkermansia sp.]